MEVFLQDWLLFPTDWNWRLDPKLGGELRAVSDIGTHWLDLMMWITGRKVTEVCADLATVVPVRHRPAAAWKLFRRPPMPNSTMSPLPPMTMPPSFCISKTIFAA